jgi:hypothetical protein
VRFIESISKEIGIYRNPPEHGNKQETGKGLDSAEPARLDGMQPEEVEARRSRSRERMTCSSSEPPRTGVVGNHGSASYPAARARDSEAVDWRWDEILPNATTICPQPHPELHLHLLHHRQPLFPPHPELRLHLLQEQRSPPQ